MKTLTKRQSEILKFIREYSSINGYPPSIREIAKHFFIKSPSGAKKHVDALVKKGYLSRGRGARTIGEERFYMDSVKMVPVIGKVAAGIPILAVENIMGEIPLPESMAEGKEIFILRVEGDSMTDVGIDSGDYLVVRQQQTVEQGDIVIAIIDGDATVKRFFKRENTVILKPENKNMNPIEVKKGDFLIAGKVISVIKMLEGKKIF
ncbi:MAG: transcriptional repressor LexA [Proteobacteria bacterium]|nr:transcriptional repressor LexA [Pseudomonadota bacterium]